MNNPQQTTYVASTQPVGQLKTDRGLLKFLLLSLITCGIYSIVFFSSLSNDINVIVSRYDGRKTMHFALLLFLIGPLTLGIGYLVWFHKMSIRIGNELRRRNINNNFTASDFWPWNVLATWLLSAPLFTYTNCAGQAICWLLTIT